MLYRVKCTDFLLFKPFLTLHWWRVCGIVHFKASSPLCVSVSDAVVTVYMTWWEVHVDDDNQIFFKSFHKVYDATVETLKPHTQTVQRIIKTHDIHPGRHVYFAELSHQRHKVLLMTNNTRWIKIWDTGYKKVVWVLNLHDDLKMYNVVIALCISWIYLEIVSVL